MYYEDNRLVKNVDGVRRDTLQNCELLRSRCIPDEDAWDMIVDHVQ